MHWCLGWTAGMMGGCEKNLGGTRARLASFRPWAPVGGDRHPILNARPEGSCLTVEVEFPGRARVAGRSTRARASCLVHLANAAAEVKCPRRNSSAAGLQN